MRIRSFAPMALAPAIFPAPLAAAAHEAASAELRTADGAHAGEVRFEQVEHGVVIEADLRGLPEGGHGFHIHERGACDAPGFKSAGGHFAPQNKKHGYDAPGGYHAGDLPNIYAGADGSAHAAFFSPLISLAPNEGNGQMTAHPLLDRNGSAIIIHAQADDYRATPADSTGARIACGVIQAAQP